MGLLTQFILLCFCTLISESREPHSRFPLSMPHSLFSGKFTPHYPEDINFEHFYDNFFNWHKENHKKDPNYRYPNLFHYNNHESTTETTTAEQFTDSTESSEVREPFPLQSHEEITNKANNEIMKEEIDESSKSTAKIVVEKVIKKDEDHKDSDKSEVIISDIKLNTNENNLRETGTKDDKLSKSTEHDAAMNMGQMNTIALPIGNMIIPAISIQSMNQGPPVLNPGEVTKPEGNINGYSAPSLVSRNNEPADTNDDIRRSVPQAVPLNIAQNPVNNDVQPNAYNIATMPNNAMVNNIPNSYYLVNNNQAVPINNGLQTQPPSQLYALVPINTLGNNVITNQLGNFVNQQNQNYGILNQASNIVAYKQQDNNVHVNQPNNYVPLSQSNYVTWNNQPTNFVPLNNQGNQYVTNQPNNLVQFSQPNNLVAVNNNQQSNMLTVGNQPNNYVVLNNQPNNMIPVNNQPNNLVALNSGGNIPFIVQAQPQPNIVLYSLKDEDKNDDADKREEEKDREISDHDEIHPSEQPIEAADV